MRNSEFLFLVLGNPSIMEMGPRYTKPLNKAPRINVLMSIEEGLWESGYLGTLETSMRYNIQCRKWY
jgi:hypothetical protein